MSSKPNKRYCNGCIHSEWHAGIGAGLAAKLGLRGASEPTHKCNAYDRTRTRWQYNMPKMRGCTAQCFDKPEAEVNP